jgi:hypothetical protein
MGAKGNPAMGACEVMPVTVEVRALNGYWFVSLVYGYATRVCIAKHGYEHDADDQADRLRDALRGR